MKRVTWLLLTLLVAAVPASWAQSGAYFSVVSTGGTSVTTTAETVGCTLTIPLVKFATTKLHLTGQVNDSTSASTTFTTVRIRRGSDSTGTLVGAANPVTTAASSLFTIPISGDDSPGDVVGQNYVVTVAGTASAGTGKIKFCYLGAVAY